MKGKKTKLTFSEGLAVRSAVNIRLDFVTRRIDELLEYQRLGADSHLDDDLLLVLREERVQLESAKKKLFYFTSVSL